MANITLRCADERLNDVIYKNFPENVTLAELGGIKWYLSRDTLEELFEQVEFALDHKDAKSLSLVSHSDCGLYKELGEDSDSQYEDDLREAIDLIQERFPALKIQGSIYDVDTKQLRRLENE